MPLIERLLRSIPVVRRPYLQRDAARAEVETLKARLAGDTRALDAEVRRFFPSPQLYLLPGDDARQDREIGDFRPWIKRAVPKTARTLEIGPSFNPVLAKAEGYNVAVLDHLDAAGLIAKYGAYGVDTSKVEPVDFVWRDGSIAETAGNARYEAIVACHVIEHAPDFVRFLNGCADALTDGGTLYLLIPDKRYSFDFFQPLTDIAKVMGDQRAARTRHSFESFYRVGSSVQNAEGAHAWDQKGVAGLTFQHGDPNHSRHMAKKHTASRDYEDAHANCFTPMSFLMLIDELRYLHEIGLEVTLLTRSRGCEFLTVLRRPQGGESTPDDFLARKMCAYKVLMREELERIQSVRMG